MAANLAVHESAGRHFAGQRRTWLSMMALGGIPPWLNPALRSWTRPCCGLPWGEGRPMMGKLCRCLRSPEEWRASLCFSSLTASPEAGLQGAAHSTVRLHTQHATDCCDCVGGLSPRDLEVCSSTAELRKRKREHVTACAAQILF